MRERYLTEVGGIYVCKETNIYPAEYRYVLSDELPSSHAEPALCSCKLHPVTSQVAYAAKWVPLSTCHLCSYLPQIGFKLRFKERGVVRSACGEGHVGN